MQRFSSDSVTGLRNSPTTPSLGSEVAPFGFCFSLPARDGLRSLLL
jgi:hypothetical protein